MSIKEMTISEQAFAYHVQGYSVMPCKPDKRPALTSWKPYQTKQATDEQVIEWFKDNKTNIGIITGKISGITVVDIDTKSGQADEILKKFPKTYTVRTPSGGYHLYYQYAEGFTVSANAYPNLPNVDIRSDGGFVVAPPSKTEKGIYEIINRIEPQTFPIQIFPKQKEKRKVSALIGVKSGGRNDSIASFIGKLLHLEKNEKNWSTEVWSAVVRANLTYSPPLPEHELKTTFDSIVKKELEHRKGLVLSPFQTEEGEDFSIPLRKANNGVAYRDMANAVAVLENHPYYKGTLKYNTFTFDIEYHGKPFEDADIHKIQYFMQTVIGLSNIPENTIYSAIVHVAKKNAYDEAQDWLKSLVWDGIPRVSDWLHKATGVANDEYHRGIGSQWLMGIIKRIMIPGITFDYMLVLVGKQGIGKTSLFRIIGGKWYKSFTGSVENKDFYLTLRGAIIIDLDEGATLYKAEAIKIKSIITDVVDEFRAPYDRVMKKYPRRFVFSMSTNDNEPFRDVTGNRRYWVLDLPDNMVDFKWLEDNRDQLFAEAYHHFKEKTETSAVPFEEAERRQEAHLPDDSWTELVVDYIRQSADYCEGNREYNTTILEVYKGIFPDDGVLRLDRKQEIRIGNILRKELGLEKVRKMIDGEQKNRYYISEKMLKKLQKEHAKPTEKDDLDKLVDDISEDKKDF